MKIERWRTERDGPLSERAVRAKLEGMGYRVHRYVYPPGTRFPEHSHQQGKIDAVLSGQFRIRMHGRDVVLGPGDWVEVPCGVVHSAEVVGPEPVVSLDAVEYRRQK